jgi:hypothetical protein
MIQLLTLNSYHSSLPLLVHEAMRYWHLCFEKRLDEHSSLTLDYYLPELAPTWNAYLLLINIPVIYCASSRHQSGYLCRR